LAELKRIRVRAAKARDIGLFKKLVMEAMQEQEKQGSIMRAGDGTLAVCEQLFHMYLDEDLEGVVLFVADRGLLLWGDAASTMDSSLGKVITAWVTYVVPGSPEGVREALSQHAEEWAKEHGFEGIQVNSFRESPPMEGYEPVVTVLYREIRS